MMAALLSPLAMAQKPQVVLSAPGTGSPFAAAVTATVPPACSGDAGRRSSAAKSSAVVQGLPPVDQGPLGGTMRLVLADEEDVLRRHGPDQQRPLVVDEALQNLPGPRLVPRVGIGVPADGTLAALRRRARRASGGRSEAGKGVNVLKPGQVGCLAVELVAPDDNLPGGRLTAEGAVLESPQAEPDGLDAVGTDRAEAARVHDLVERLHRSWRSGYGPDHHAGRASHARGSRIGRSRSEHRGCGRDTGDAEQAGTAPRELKLHKMFPSAMLTGPRDPRPAQRGAGSSVAWRAVY